MERLGVRVMTHAPAGSDGRRVAARAKGKAERPFRTVKEAHETLYHFDKPKTEAEANDWLMRFLDRYNAQPHRREGHSRIEDWIANLPEGGIRQMCAWDRYFAFAREPELRDGRVRARGEGGSDAPAEGAAPVARPRRAPAGREGEERQGTLF
jgi:hypothetical protein